MVLLRPFLKTNRERSRVGHLPFFFILIVSNAGGLLTPLGDPPLFLGYLRGVPFFWTLRLLPIWLVANGYLLALFLVIDTLAHRRETKVALRADRGSIEPLRLKGLPSLALLAIVAASALLPSPWREITMLACAATSYFTAPRSYHAHNAFNFTPIAEVAILFAGIFITMVPALEILHARSTSLGITEPWQFFWLTGGLSSLLDNAPTYLTFLSLAQGISQGGPVVGISHVLLTAISAGAVLMGANTYIGNGPNFMVKAIAEHSGAHLPSFVGFALRAVLVMLPLYLAVTYLFFR
jgi:Na+/H+ antiporter NhaD/arsenite permease-like protein